MYKYIKYPFIIILIIIASNVYSTNDLQFRTFSPKGGFNYNGVSSIAQDAEGFIWILMEYNILRFDGNEYKPYFQKFNSLDVEASWYFYDLKVNLKGELYISSNNGLFKYNKLHDTFDKLYNNAVSAFNIDRQGTIWILSNNQLLKFDEDSKIVHVPEHVGKKMQAISLFQNIDNKVYMAAPYQKIYVADIENNTNSIDLFYEFPSSQSIIDLQYANNKFWVLMKNGIYKLNVNTRTIEDFFEFSHEYEIKNLSPKKIHIDKRGDIWIGTQQGLFVLEPLTRKYSIYQHSPYNEYSLPNSSIWAIAADRQQNIWIGTFSGGLCYANLETQTIFKTYTTQNKQLNHSLVSCFAEDDNHLWIGTEGGGINCFDKKTNQFSYLMHNKEKSTISSNNIKSMLIDPDHNLWIATFRGGLNCYNIKTKSNTKYIESEDKSGLLNDNLRKIVQEQDSGIWIAYQLNRPKISFLSFKNKEISHFNLDESSKASFIFDMQKGNNNDLWAVSKFKLYRFHISDQKTEIVLSDDLMPFNAQSLLIDGSTVWIGTIGNGIIKYNTETKETIVLKEILDFNVSAIYSICKDVLGYLWFGTDNGLIRYNSETGEYLEFDESEGLQGQAYYPLACMNSVSGKLYFGGTNGFTTVIPENIRENKFKPEPVISNFLIDNEMVLPVFKDAKSEYWDNTIVLKYDEENFGFQFSSNNYQVPEKNKYMYRLKGYDDKWIMTDARNRTAYYSKVPAGSYQFELLASNNDGIWGEAAKVIHIKRLPSPWLSWKAYTVYSLLVLGLAMAFAYHYNERKKLKMQLYLDKLDKEKNEEIHQAQLSFFTNISHDFRTPLSLILATLDNLKQKGADNNFHRILNNNATRLLNLVNELMEFRTVENGKMQLKVQEVYLNSMVETLAMDFEDYAHHRQISFEIKLDPEIEKIKIYAEEQLLEKIIINLLNNAFKYTQDGGSVVIETFCNSNKFKSVYRDSYTVPSPAYDDAYFSIAIRDTGFGISKESIKKVFERFYKVNTANTGKHLGTGIGLALVKSLVNLHKGRISIYSQRDTGTDMVVDLPLFAYAYNENEWFDSESKNQNMLNQLETNLTGYLSDNHTPIIQPGDMLLRDKKQILIVEDNEELRTLLSGFFADFFEIKEAANGLEATEILKGTEIDLIVSDIMMPIKDGVALLKEVKSDINTSHIPFILLTAKSELDTKLESAALGADIYFEKPINLNLLYLSIQNIFAQRQKLREFYSKNFYADTSQLSTNEKDNTFLKSLIDTIDVNLNSPTIDVNYIASELSMSRSKLYSKVKMITDKSIVEFILQYKLRKAAQKLIETDLPIYQIIEEIGIRSQSYFTSAFKKEFGETPTAFAAKHKGDSKT